MKKVLFLIALVCITGCKSEVENNIKEFVENKIASDPRYTTGETESFKVEKQDSLPSALPVTFCDIEASKAMTKFYKGELTAPEAQKIILKQLEIISAIELAWKYNMIDENDTILNDPIYEKRAVYKVNAKLKTKHQIEMRVMMDNDGITPYTTDEDVESECSKAFIKISNELENLIYSF